MKHFVYDGIFQLRQYFWVCRQLDMPVFVQDRLILFIPLNKGSQIYLEKRAEIDCVFILSLPGLTVHRGKRIVV